MIHHPQAIGAIGDEAARLHELGSTENAGKAVAVGEIHDALPFPDRQCGEVDQNGLRARLEGGRECSVEVFAV